MDKEELTLKFLQQYSKQVSEGEKAITDASAAIGSTDDLEQKILLCEDAITAFKSFRSFCYKAGQGGRIYFQDMWEHCHNSRNPDFSYIDSIIRMKDRLVRQIKKNP